MSYSDALSQTAQRRLIHQYGTNAKRYGTVASWWTMLKSFVFDVMRHSNAQSLFLANHPAQLHYGIWDKPLMFTFDQAIRRATTLAFESIFPAYTDKKKRIIHFGSGFGGVDIQLCKEHPTLHTCGISIDPTQIGIAQELAQLHRVRSRAQFVEANFLKLPTTVGTYDGGLSLEATCHVPVSQLPLLWKNIYSVLKPGARFVIHDWYLEKKVYGTSAKKLATFHKGWDLPSTPTKKAFVNAAKSANFTLVSERNFTRQIMKSANRIHLRATLFTWLIKLFQNSSLPYIKSLGVTTPDAFDFANTSLVQKELFETGVLGYYQLVFQKTNLL